IIFGGEMVVSNASSIAISLGMSQALVGLTIVAIGTSLPELVTSITAALKGEASIAIGNIVGSNIFNIFFVAGLSATIEPFTVSFSLVEKKTYQNRRCHFNSILCSLSRIYYFKRVKSWCREKLLDCVIKKKSQIRSLHYNVVTRQTLIRER